MNSLYDPAALGQTYEAVGPQRLTQVVGHQQQMLSFGTLAIFEDFF
jgi:hypothetical protein